jgi:hypothetical protein
MSAATSGNEGPLFRRGQGWGSLSLKESASVQGGEDGFDRFEGGIAGPPDSEGGLEVRIKS